MASLNEDRAAVERSERLPGQLERDRHYAPRCLAMNLAPGGAIAGNPANFCLAKDRGIKLRCLFRLMIELQAWCDWLPRAPFLPAHRPTAMAGGIACRLRRRLACLRSECAPVRYPGEYAPDLGDGRAQPQTAPPLGIVSGG